MKNFITVMLGNSDDVKHLDVNTAIRINHIQESTDKDTSKSNRTNRSTQPTKGNI